MIGALAGLVQPLLMGMDPERAHRLAIKALKSGLVQAPPVRPDPRLAVSLWDLEFSGPLGMAAGFDKDGEVPDALLGLGFGFVEIGTVAPASQPGNPAPRVFRLPDAQAVINRYGFNTAGQAAVLANLRDRRKKGGIVGINVGANKLSEDKPADYVAGIAAFAREASYLTINISSPNTPGLRDLHHDQALEDLLGRTRAERDRQSAAIGRHVPMLLKISPDLDDQALDAVADAILRHGFDGAIVSNTTVDRTGLRGRHAGEAGGLSGRPLFDRSTILLARLRQRTGPGVPLIGVGGIDSVQTAYEKIRAGASLLQLYTGLIYRGYRLIAEINRGLAQNLRRDGFDTITDAVGAATDDWAAREIE